MYVLNELDNFVYENMGIRYKDFTKNRVSGAEVGICEDEYITYKVERIRGDKTELYFIALRAVMRELTVTIYTAEGIIHHFTTLTDKPTSIRKHGLIEKRPLMFMRAHYGAWAVYENQDLSSPDVGRLKFLKYGRDCTMLFPPQTYPDSNAWQYVLIGEVDVKTGDVLTFK